ncbi:MAG: hypothetical protein GC205_04515 [Bacteroidetes bacterium]|nr:hypothetical protein [Bacteroidota bacterium]
MKQDMMQILSFCQYFKSLTKLATACAGLLTIAACAEIATPQGGPKDVAPPALLGARPPENSVLVEPKEVVLEFDEFIEVKDAFTQVLLSPPMSKSPTLTVKGKSLYILFPDSFLANKTYTLQFGDALRDQNEGNILKNFQYVFSTGPVLDSLTLSGTVTDRLSGNPEKDMLVMLYPGMDPELVTNGRPYYFARTDASGSFKLNNLQAGQYRIFALGDQNFNYQYDLPNEKIGFIDSLITVDPIQREYTLQTFTERSGSGQLVKARALRYGKMELIFNGNTDSSSLRIAGLNNLSESVWEWNRSRDSLQLWVKDLTLDSLRFFQSGDTTETSRLVLLKSASKDSLVAATKLILSPSFPVSLGGKKGPVTASANLNAVSFDLGKQVVFKLANPGQSLDTNRILITLDPAGDTIPVSMEWANSRKTALQLNVDWMPEQRYRLEIFPGLVTDWYGISNDSARYLLQLKAKKEYGDISFQLSLPDTLAFVFELLDVSGKVVRTETITNQTQVKINHTFLAPGNYRARLTLDENKNGEWDPGNFRDGKLAEPVFYFQETIALRGDWQLQFDWIFTDTQGAGLQ